MSFAAHAEYLGELPVPAGGRPIGYAALISGLGLDRPASAPCVTFDRHSRVLSDGDWRVIGIRRAPPDTALGHLDFALKQEALDLAVLKAAFLSLGRQEIARYVTETRTGTPNRKAWFLYERSEEHTSELQSLMTIS